MTKVTIPREVADAIEYLRKVEGGGSTYSNEMIALLYADINISGDAAVTLRKIPFDTLMRALLDGYERELTEEEVREKTLEDIAGKYARVCDGYSGYETSDEDIAFSDGMVFVLDALNIKIPEVNA